MASLPLSLRSASLLRSAAPSGLRALSTKPPSAPAPTSHDRTSPKTHTSNPHPGYTAYETPATSAHPKDMPPAQDGAVPSSTVQQASTKPHPSHPDAAELAQGASSSAGGSDAISAGSERNVKGWGPNARSADFNREEGKRRPVLDGGSNEAKGAKK